MKVVHLSYSDIAGGAARAAYRLHMGLRMAGVDSKMLVVEKVSADPDVTCLAVSASPIARLARRWLKSRRERALHIKGWRDGAGWEAFSPAKRTFLGENILQAVGRPDIVHLHWVAGMIDFTTDLSDLTELAPTVWTLHDMNPLTGGCHYDNGCGRFALGCGRCPALGSAKMNDLSAASWRYKDRDYGRIDPQRMHVVTLSQWMRSTVEQSPLLNRFPASVIPNSLDLEVFRPRDKRSAKAAFGLPVELPAVLFVAHATSIHRKGFQVLVDAIQHGDSGVRGLLLSVGGQKPAVSTNWPHIHFGTVQDDRLLSAIYSAADVFVCPSLQDNLPNTVMEAMACGTPVVAFNTGGLPDMIQSEKTGILVTTGDIAALAAAIGRILTGNDTRREMGCNARAAAEMKYSQQTQAQRYSRLYETILPQQLAAASMKSAMKI